MSLGAISAAAMGLQDAGTTSLTWGGAHVIGQYRDPQTGEFVFINYGDLFKVNSNHISEAALFASRYVSGFSNVNIVETGTGTFQRTPAD